MDGLQSRIILEPKPKMVREVIDILKPLRDTTNDLVYSTREESNKTDLINLHKPKDDRNPEKYKDNTDDNKIVNDDKATIQTGTTNLHEKQQ